MKKKNKLKIEQQQSLIKSISDNISEGIYRSVPGKRFVYVNRAFLSMFGYVSLEQLNRGPAARLYASKANLERVRDLLAEDSWCLNLEVQLSKKDKSVFWASISAKIILDEDGKKFIDGAIRDVTAQKEAEIRQSESQKFLERILDAVPTPVYVKDQNHRLILFNDQYLKYFKQSRNKLLHKTILEYLKIEKAAVETYWKRDETRFGGGRKKVNRERFESSKGQFSDVNTFTRQV